MSLRTTATLSIATLFLAQLPAAAAQQTAAASPAAATTVVVPQGTLIPLNLVNPIKHKSTRPGDTVQAKVAFPITVGDQIAIPAGTTVEGTFVAPAKGKKSANQPPVTIHFTRLIYANGYTVSLDANNTAVLANPPLPQPTGTEMAQLEMPPSHGPSPSPEYLPEPQITTTPPTLTNPYAHAGPTTKELVAFTVGPVAFVGGLYLLARLALPHGDYTIEAAGWQFQMILQDPLPVDIARVNAAAATPAP